MKHKAGKLGIYLLPNLLTTVSLFAAFFSIVASMQMDYELAAIAIFVGIVTDGLDGRIARMTNTETAFGAEYDSLSDMVTFGIAPPLLLYRWILESMGKLGWLIAFLFTAAVALRLARFNTQLHISDKRYFQGLSSTLAAANVTSFVWLCQQHHWHNQLVVIATALLSFSMAALMVSNIRYYSFKQLDFKGKVSFGYVIFLVALFVSVALAPSFVIWLASLAYAISGPLQTLFALQRMRKFRLHRRKAKQRREN